MLLILSENCVANRGEKVLLLLQKATVLSDKKQRKTEPVNEAQELHKQRQQEWLTEIIADKILARVKFNRFQVSCFQKNDSFFCIFFFRHKITNKIPQRSKHRKEC